MAYVLLEDEARFDGDPVGATGYVTGEVVFTTGMAGYQESVTDPSLPPPDHRVHVPAHRQLRRERGGDGVRRDPRARRGHARGDQLREDAPGAEMGWLDWLAESGIPAITGVDTRALVRHLRDKGAMRGGIFPSGMAETQAHGARPRRGADDRPGPRPRGHAERAGPARASRATARGSWPSTPASRRSIVRNLVARGARVELHPCTRDRRRAAGPRRRRRLPRQRPRRPGRARLRRRHAARARGQEADVRHLPRPPAAVRGRSGSRRSSCRSATAARNHPVKDLETGTDRDHLAEPRLRGARARRRAAHRRRRAGALGDRLRRGRSCRHVNLYDRTVEGLTLLDVPGGDGPVPPRGRARARTTPCTSSTASWSRSRVPRRDDIHKILDPRLRPDRHRPGGRVRLLRRAGLQGAARGGLRGRARQLEPGDDHDRPGVRRRDVRRAAAARARSRRSSSKRAPRRAAADARRPDRAEPRARRCTRTARSSATASSSSARTTTRSTAPRTATCSARRWSAPGCACRAARSPHTVDEALAALRATSACRSIVRPAFTLGGRGGGIARDRDEFRRDRAPRAWPRRRSARCCSTSRCSAGASSSSRSCATTTTTS